MDSKRTYSVTLAYCIAQYTMQKEGNNHKTKLIDVTIIKTGTGICEF